MHKTLLVCPFKIFRARNWMDAKGLTLSPIENTETNQQKLQFQSSLGWKVEN